MRRLPLLVLCAACGIASLPARADDDALSTDRPDFVESSQVVGRGRVQLETSIQRERQHDDGVRTTVLATPTLLRIGLDERTELRIETDGVVRADSTPDGGAATRVRGGADTAIGIKWHAADEDGNAPSLGVLLHADLPSGARSLRGSGVRPSLRVAAEWTLAGGLSFGMMPGVGTDNDERGARRGYGILAATLGKAFDPRLRGFVELAAPRIARAARGGTEASLDTGLAWLVNDDVQLDTMFAHGLNRRTPAATMALGLSVRL